uniref:Tetraspanin n=1 Tax=Kalanchoe fedtschenkoi TaxID=63787 RepID=A0A7N0ZWP4_KALFE
MATKGSKSSHKTATCLNFIALLCSLLVIGSGIWVSGQPATRCSHAYRWHVVILGVLLLLVSLAGFVGSYWSKPDLLGFHLFCMACLATLLLIIVIFAYVVTHHTGAYRVPGGEYEEYQIGGFSDWLKDHVLGTTWEDTRRCLLTQTALCSYDLHSTPNVSPLQSGCCKPPTVCGFSYVNPTVWVNPVNPTAHIDCLLWSNDPTQLCYGCNSCKAGLLGSIRHEWRKTDVFLVTALAILILVYVVGCSAYKRAQTK